MVRPHLQSGVRHSHHTAVYRNDRGLTHSSLVDVGARSFMALGGRANTLYPLLSLLRPGTCSRLHFLQARGLRRARRADLDAGA